MFRRQGFEADLKLIAQAKAEHCVEVLFGSAGKPSERQSLEQLAHDAKIPEELRKAMGQVLFSTANVPFSDGYLRKLRHEGHNLNAVHGPLKLFVTANFADVYSPILLSMTLCDSVGKPVGDPLLLRKDD